MAWSLQGKVKGKKLWWSGRSPAGVVIALLSDGLDDVSVLEGARAFYASHLDRFFGGPDRTHWKRWERPRILLFRAEVMIGSGEG